MNRIALLILILAASNLFAQKTKTVKIYEMQTIALNAYVSFSDSGSVVDTSYLLIGRDRRYEQLIEYIKLKSTKDIRVIYRIAKKIQEALKEEDGTWIEYEGSTLQVSKSFGVTLVSLYGFGNNSNGYTYFGKAQARDLISSIEQFAKRSGIVLIK